ncbi:MAG: reprolysin-like metallopeptidase [Bacteroidota bacterium]
MRAKLHFVLSITMFFGWFYGFSQQYWQPLPQSAVPTADSASIIQREFQLDRVLFTKALNAGLQLYFPDRKGELIPFAIKQAPVFHPELSRKYPQIQSFVGTNSEQQCKVRFSISPKGISAMLMDYKAGKSSFIEPLKNTLGHYRSYASRLRSGPSVFTCGTKASALPTGSSKGLVDAQILRTFRIAVSTTGEYTNYHGGTVVDALAAINATLTRVNEVFETDLGVRLQLVANNDEVIFTNGTTDPYNGNLNAQVQNTLTTIIGEANYDVGHLFNFDNDNGNAGFIGSVCVDNQKGSAFSSALEPEGDLFDLDYVAHELGHQFGANHTWSFESEGTGVQAEPASGTTIMGYAGIVEGNNVAPNGEDYFHHNSIVQISNYLETLSCGQVTSLTNSAPVIVPEQDYAIPKGTAFALSANVTDPEGDLLTYTWEQIDDGVVTTATFGPENVSGANFRSVRPSTSPTRYFPRISRVVAGELQQENPQENAAWETVASVGRLLNFALTVRDNNSEGGQVASDSVQIRVIDAAGPFQVTSQNNGEVYSAGSIQEIRWEVANTDIAPVGTQLVDLLLSLDGGLSFPILVAENLPNTGTATIQLPGQASGETRVMVRAVNNVFFAVNTMDFTVEESAVVLNFEAASYTTCKPDDLTIPFTYETYGGFTNTMNLTVNAPMGISAAFSQSSVGINGTDIDLVLSNFSGVPVGAYPVEVIASDGVLTFSTTLQIHVSEDTFETVVLQQPSDLSVGTSVNPEFTWTAVTNTSGYDIEIATDETFTTIVESATVFSNTYESQSLTDQSTYFWRVRPRNDCGEGSFGIPFSFTTTVINCATFESTDLPVTISEEGTPTVRSSFFFNQDLQIADVNVNLQIAHTYLEDLIVSLIAPSGTKIVLVSKICGSLNNISAVFDDDGQVISCAGNPAISGVIQPQGVLSTLEGESTFGEWVLEIEDTAPSDGGILEAFSLAFCVEGVFRPDEDEDGVFDDGDDLCLGTPKGVPVDTSGCPLNIFSPTNFTISIASEACLNSNDGQIAVTAEDTALIYTATLSGNGTDVTQEFAVTQDFQNLSAGSYSLCITGTNGTDNYRETCFEIVIEEPEPLAVLATLETNEQQLRVQLSGGTFYTIQWNGEVTQTLEDQITLPMTSGANTLKVSTGLLCQGVFEDQFFLTDTPIVYPNPVTAILSVALGSSETDASLTVYGANGGLVLRDQKPIGATVMQTDLSSLSNGVYYLVIESGVRRYTSKIVKR